MIRDNPTTSDSGDEDDDNNTTSVTNTQPNVSLAILQPGVIDPAPGNSKGLKNILILEADWWIWIMFVVVCCAVYGLGYRRLSIDLTSSFFKVIFILSRN